MTISELRRRARQTFGLINDYELYFDEEPGCCAKVLSHDNRVYFCHGSDYAYIWFYTSAGETFEYSTKGEEAFFCFQPAYGAATPLQEKSWLDAVWKMLWKADIAHNGWMALLDIWFPADAAQ